jgi:hypothetical protein
MLVALSALSYKGLYALGAMLLFLDFDRVQCPPSSPKIRKAMQEIAALRRRFGYRRVGLLLDRRDIEDNRLSGRCSWWYVILIRLSMTYQIHIGHTFANAML